MTQPKPSADEVLLGLRGITATYSADHPVLTKHVEAAIALIQQLSAERQAVARECAEICLRQHPPHGELAAKIRSAFDIKD